MSHYKMNAFSTSHRKTFQEKEVRVRRDSSFSSGYFSCQDSCEGELIIIWKYIFTLRKNFDTGGFTKFLC